LNYPGHLQGERIFTYKDVLIQLNKHVLLTSYSVVSEHALAEGRRQGITLKGTTLIRKQVLLLLRNKFGLETV
jgi:hypothetical protein